MATTSKVLGTVTSVVGEVKATASDGTTRILQVGDKVFSDEVISTSPTGDVKIALEGGGHTLECGNDSNLALHEGLLGIGTAVATQDSSPVVAPSVAAQQEMAAPGAKPPAGARFRSLAGEVCCRIATPRALRHNNCAPALCRDSDMGYYNFG